MHSRPPPDPPALDSRSVQGYLSLGNAYTKYPLLGQPEGLPQLVRRIMGASGNDGALSLDTREDHG